MMDILLEWMCANKLSLNTAKTQFLVISQHPSHKNIKIRYNNQELLQIGSAGNNSYKYLRLFVDDKLSWQMHASRVLSSLILESMLSPKLNYAPALK